MKRRKMRLGAVLVLGIMLGACTQISDFESPVEKEQGQELGDGQGLLSLSLYGGADFTTRALQESSYKNVDNYTVVVVDKDGVEKMNCKGSEVASKMPLTMSIGSYAIKAFYGTELPASRDAFYVYGEVKGSIKADQEESVNVVCTPTCGRIAVNFDDVMSTYYSDYYVTFTGTQALGTETISWLKGDTEPWYVKLNEGGERITFTITTTVKEEYVNNEQQGDTKTGTFTLDRNKGYKMNISANYTPTDLGNIEINVTIDESTNDKPVDIEVPIEWT
jgi:hypothetical protein